MPPYTITGENTAKPIKSRFDGDILKSIIELQWWNFEDAVISEIRPLLQSPPGMNTLYLIKEILTRSSRTMPDH